MVWSCGSDRIGLNLRLARRRHNFRTITINSASIDSLLVASGHQAQSDFRDYFGKHRAAVMPGRGLSDGSPAD